MTDSPPPAAPPPPPLPSSPSATVPPPGFVNGLLVALLISLGLLSLLGLLALLTGQVGEDEAKVLGSTFAVALFTGAGLASAIRFERGLYVPLGWVGVIASGIAALLTIAVIWAEPPEAFFRPWATVNLTALFLAFASLLLLVRPKASAVSVMLGVALVGLGLLWVLSVILTWGDIAEVEGLGKLYGAVGIITLFATLASPILNRLLSRP